MSKRHVLPIVFAMAACSGTGESAVERISTPVGGSNEDVPVSTSSFDLLSPTTSASITIPDSFEAFADATGSIVAFRGTTPSEDGIVRINAATTDGHIAVFATEFDNEVLPVTGDAVYEGGYAGLLRQDAPDVQVLPITGIAQLVADFSDQSISGNIVNRRVAYPDGSVRATASLLLDPTALVEGAFVGMTARGDINTTSRGTLAGVYAGSINNDEVIGTVEVTHTADSVITGKEVGAIIASN